MAFSTIYTSPGDTVRWVNGTGGAVAYGTVQQYGELFGILSGSDDPSGATTLANGATGDLRIAGVVGLPKKSGDTFTNGQAAFWDSTNLYVTSTPIHGSRIGVAVVDPRGATAMGGSTDALITVLLNTIAQKSGAVNAITAYAGGGQASATQLTASINRVTTVATAADSVKLPAAVAGQVITVINAAAANAMTVYPQTGEIINALSANAGLSVAVNKTITFFCAVAGTWNSQLTA